MINRQKILLIFLIIFLVVIAAIEVFPYFWMVTGSFKTLKEIIAFPPTLLPKVFQFQNYAEAWGSGPFPRYILNSLIVTTSILCIQIFLCCLAAYAFAKLNFPGKGFFFIVILSCMMVPEQIRFVPLYIFFSKVSMIDTYLALILPFTVSSLGIFLIRQAFMSIHNDYIDAAKLDGANTFSIIFRLLVPMSKGTIIAFSLFSIIYHWNNYFWPLVMSSSDTVRTLPVGIAMLREQGTGARWHIIMAGNMFSVIPIFLVFFFAQKTIMKSFAMTGIKG